MNFVVQGSLLIASQTSWLIYPFISDFSLSSRGETESRNACGTILLDAGCSMLNEPTRPGLDYRHDWSQVPGARSEVQLVGNIQ